MDLVEVFDIFFDVFTCNLDAIHFFIGMELLRRFVMNLRRFCYLAEVMKGEGKFENYFFYQHSFLMNYLNTAHY